MCIEFLLECGALLEYDALIILYELVKKSNLLRLFYKAVMCGLIFRVMVISSKNVRVWIIFI